MNKLPNSVNLTRKSQNQFQYLSYLAKKTPKQINDDASSGYESVSPRQSEKFKELMSYNLD